jgi:hypothetical protein
MKKFLVLMIAVASGISLCADIFIPDPLPFLDEALLLAIFTKSMAYLGMDFTRFIPFMRKKPANSGGRAQPAGANPAGSGPTIDI